MDAGFGELDGLGLAALHPIDAGVLWNLHGLVLNGAFGIFLLGDDLGLLLDLGLMLGGLGPRAREIHHVEGDLFPIAALDAVVADAVGLHLVFADQLVGAVLQVKLEIGGPGQESQERRVAGGTCA